MDINKYTQKSQEAIIKAQSLAVERHHQEVTSRHLLYSLLLQEDGIIPALYKSPESTLMKLNPCRRHTGAYSVSPRL